MMRIRCLFKFLNNEAKYAYLDTYQIQQAIGHKRMRIAARITSTS